MAARICLLLLISTLLWDTARAALPQRIAAVDLAQGPGTVVVFLSSLCPCSRSHEIVLRELATDFQSKGFKFVGVNSNANEPDALAREHFSGASLGFPVVRDREAELANAFGALKTPHAFVVRKGEIVFQGGVDDSSDAALARKHFLRDALEALSNGKDPEIRQARALGCVIKRD